MHPVCSCMGGGGGGGGGGCAWVCVLVCPDDFFKTTIVQIFCQLIVLMNFHARFWGVLWT